MNFVSITSPDVNNGQGNRVTCWISGCKHKCDGCHNKWLQDYSKGNSLSMAKGRIYEELSHEYIKGITFSGGDPLCQDNDSLDELYALIQDIKQDFPLKDIWIFSGFTLGELMKIGNEHQLSILNECDYFVDGKFEKDKKDAQLAFRGSSNQVIWKVNGGNFERVPDEYFRN